MILLPDLVVASRQQLQEFLQILGPLPGRFLPHVVLHVHHEALGQVGLPAVHLGELHVALCIIARALCADGLRGGCEHRCTRADPVHGDDRLRPVQLSDNCY